MVFPLTKLNKEGTLLNASNAYYSEEYAQRMEEFRKAQAEVEQKKEKPMSQKMFKVV